MDASDGGDYGEWREEWGSNMPLETHFVFVWDEELWAQNSHRLNILFE